MERRDATRYFVLGALAAIPMLGVGHIKPIPLAFAAVFFFVHGLLSSATASRESYWPRDFLTSGLFLAWFGISGVATCTTLALKLWPPVTREGHGVMPIGQALGGTIVGAGLGVTVAIVASLRHPRRSRRRERSIVHAVGAVLVVVALIERRWR